MYADIIKKKVGLAFLLVYPIFQDDGATIHRAAVSLDAAVAETFNPSLAEAFNLSMDYRTQDSKMADVWPIDNVWDIVKDQVAQKSA